MKYVAALLLAICLPAIAQAKTCWEYKIVDTTIAPEASKLKKVASKRDAASPALVQVLNSLGSDGWTLMGEHTVQIQQNIPFEGQAKASNTSWTASLSPEVALFRREAACKK